MNNIFFIIALALFFIACGKSKSPEVSHDTAAQTSAVSDTPKHPEMTFQVMATVTEMNETKGKITIDHEKMEGYMEAMEMPFKVSNREVFSLVTVGAKGRFKIEVTDGIGVITGVEPLQKP